MNDMLVLHTIYSIRQIHHSKEVKISRAESEFSIVVALSVCIHFMAILNKSSYRSNDYFQLEFTLFC